MSTALHWLKLGKVTRLQEGLKRKDLNWLDMLFLATTSVRFSEVPSLSNNEVATLSPMVGKFRSSYLRQPLVDLATAPHTIPEEMGRTLKIALVGYLVSRDNSPTVVGETLELEMDQVEIVTLALQRLLQAMVVLTRRS